MTDSEGAARRSPIVLVLLVNFIGTLGLSIVIPFLVFVVRRWGGEAVVYGIVASMYPLFQFVGAPVLGRWSDRIGRRKVLLLSQLGTFLSWLIFAVAFFVPETVLAEADRWKLTLPLIIVVVARALDGLTGGNISVANAYVADISTDETRSRNFGWMAASTSTGFIVGPALAGLLGSTRLGELLPVAVAAFISFVATLVIYFVLPESNPCAVHEDEQQQALRRTLGQEPKDCVDDDSTSWGRVLREPLVGFMLLQYVLIYLAFNVFYSSFPTHATAGLNWEVGRVGLFFTLLSALMVVVQGPLLGRLSKHISAPKLMIAGGLVMSLSFTSMTFSLAWLTYVSAVLFALGNGIMWPSYLAMLARTGEKRSQGSVQGLGASAGGFASIVGLLAGGILYSTLHAHTFFVAAVVIATAAVLTSRLLPVFDKPF